MARLSNLLFILLIAVSLLYVSANVVIYTVTFVSCVQNSTCPQGNPTFFNQTFSLNGTLSPNLTLNVGDQLIFNLATNVPIHPLTICQNSSIPKFCQGSDTTNQLSTPITQAGTNAAATFMNAGIYYYGCKNHPGMGAIISIVQTTTSTLPPGGPGTRHKCSGYLLLITIITLIATIFI
ncbi:unnamed protein product [Rotaria sp. Silwood1]|nr:unnamed protein product [Rotaria sp. Silwood1]CAF3616411.1 unnamed protein product [Rotaria sp. Silwood1]CAF3631318.1 unnamed protein product [Rotaria sp. Silwood1]CAF4936894.1 unnamed protein product [Rotaria sp. Silwood1]